MTKSGLPRALFGAHGAARASEAETMTAAIESAPCRRRSWSIPSIPLSPADHRPHQAILVGLGLHRP
ncbi:MAG: hypothetical protein JXA93_13920, partial [Anaerolineae bacterium]|nr:hypothetical protein [Anaerolineae bacterium]